MYSSHPLSPLIKRPIVLLDIRQILTYISMVVVWVWIMCASSVTMFGHTWARPNLLLTCSFCSFRWRKVAFFEMTRKKGSIQRAQGRITCQSNPEQR